LVEIIKMLERIGIVIAKEMLRLYEPAFLKSVKCVLSLSQGNLIQGKGTDSLKTAL
jgi:hypothetical protein